MNQIPEPIPTAPRVRPLRQFLIVFFAAAVVATLFTSWTQPGTIAANLSDLFVENSEPIFVSSGIPTPVVSPTPRPKPKIGIVAGHWGHDPGAVCPDGLAEVDINLTIATIVKQQLIEAGYDVDVLKEFDLRLSNYQAIALVSIHADSCIELTGHPSGFKVAAALANQQSSEGARLAACLEDRYGKITGLPYHAGSITQDMTDYHAFGEVHPSTPSAIIETGFMFMDRQFLTESPDLAAEGISQGILCYLRNEDVSSE